MELFISFIVGCISSLVIALFFPILREGILSYLTRLQQFISNDPINLSGVWKANFSETDHENNTFESEELINLKHMVLFLKQQEI